MLRYNTLVSRITLIFLLTVMVSILSYTVVVMKNTYDLSHRQMESLTKALSENTIENTDLVLGNMNRASIILLNSEDVRAAILNLQDPEQDYFSKRESYDELIYSSYMVTTTREFFTIAYFDSQGDLIVSTDPFENESPNLFTHTERIVEQKNVPHTILSPSENTFIFNQIERPVVCIRPMLNPSTGAIAGYVGIFTDASRFDSGNPASLERSEMIVSSYSTVLYNQFQEAIGNSDSDGNRKKGKYINSSTTSLYSGWRAEVGLPVRDYVYIAFKNELLALLLPMLLVVGATLFILVILRHTLAPLNALIRNLDYVRDGDYSHTMDESTGFSDIDTIFSGFNSMTREIDRLINTVYANELQNHKAQLQILKLQINPHFLYNTLQTIEAMGEINNTPEVCEVSHLLGKLLRYSLNSNDQVPFREEVDSVKDYLKIQKVRFEESLGYSFQVAEETKELAVPKFILQPIVENCVVHGLSEDRRLLVTLSSSLDSDHLILKLKDNGNGMAEEQLAELKEMLRRGGSSIDRSSHIGLLNVDKRLRTRFGDEYGLIINSEEGVFTEVIYTIPLNGKGTS